MHLLSQVNTQLGRQATSSISLQFLFVFQGQPEVRAFRLLPSFQSLKVSETVAVQSLGNTVSFLGCPLLSGLVQCFLSQLLLIESDGKDGFEMIFVTNWGKEAFYVKQAYNWIP